MDDGLIERIARAMEPGTWQRFDEHVAKHCPNFKWKDKVDAFLYGYSDEDYCDKLSTSLLHARAALTVLQSEIASLRGALKPFADLVAEHDGESVDTLVPVKLYHLCIALGALSVNTMG